MGLQNDQSRRVFWICRMPAMQETDVAQREIGGGIQAAIRQMRMRGKKIAGLKIKYYPCLKHRSMPLESSAGP